MSALNRNLSEENQALRQALMVEFGDEEYRYAYAESFLNTKLAGQIKTIRQQRKLTQVDIAKIMGIKQSGYARFEDVNHSVWKTDTLWKIARALGVRVNITLETFGTLIDDKLHFSQNNLERPDFNDDPTFSESIASNSKSAPERAETENYEPELVAVIERLLHEAQYGGHPGMVNNQIISDEVHSDQIADSNKVVFIDAGRSLKNTVIAHSEDSTLEWKSIANG